MSKILNFPNSVQPFAIKMKSETKAEIVIYGSIGHNPYEEGISSKQVLEEIRKMPKSVTQVDIRINSPGGDCFDGIAIFNLLKEIKAKKTVYIDGLAASMASIIALVGDEVIMGEGALYMVHLPWTFAMGNRIDLESTTGLLMDIEEQMISIYSRRSGKDRAQVRGWMEKTTWMSADETVANGFASKKSEESVRIAASALGKMSWLKNMPKIENTQEAKIKNEIESLKNKISAKLARK